MTKHKQKGLLQFYQAKLYSKKSNTPSLFSILKSHKIFIRKIDNPGFDFEGRRILITFSSRVCLIILIFFLDISAVSWILKLIHTTGIRAGNITIQYLLFHSQFLSYVLTPSFVAWICCFPKILEIHRGWKRHVCVSVPKECV